MSGYLSAGNFSPKGSAGRRTSPFNPSLDAFINVFTKSCFGVYLIAAAMKDRSGFLVGHRQIYNDPIT